MAKKKSSLKHDTTSHYFLAIIAIIAIVAILVIVFNSHKAGVADDQTNIAGQAGSDIESICNFLEQRGIDKPNICTGKDFPGKIKRCKDTDGGKNIDKKGKATGFFGSDKVLETRTDECLEKVGEHEFNNVDFCSQDNDCYVMEYWPELKDMIVGACSGEPLPCPYGCDDGACVEKYGCYETSIIGDANNDGNIDKKDADYVLKITAFITNPPENICCIDMDADGQITNSDALYILLIESGERESPGTCSKQVDSCYDYGGDGCSADVEYGEYNIYEGNDWCNETTSYRRSFCVNCTNGFEWNPSLNDCTNTSVGSFCGDYIIDYYEECELPNSYNNTNCPQVYQTCSGKIYGVRNPWGLCDAQCRCEYTSWSWRCQEGQCDAECDSNYDCNDYNASTIDICSGNCTCVYELNETNPYCGDGYKESDEECELPNTYNNTYCWQPRETCNGHLKGVRDIYGDCGSDCYCDYDDYFYFCDVEQCNAECQSDSDCDDGNQLTIDTCIDNCTCEHAQIEPECYWTEWLDRDGPSGAGDYEIFDLTKDHPCPDYIIEDVNCETKDGTVCTIAGQIVNCRIDHPMPGCWCKNTDNDGMCLDYQVQFYCC